MRTEKRTFHLKILLTENERKILNQKCRLLNISASDFIRRQIVNDTIVIDENLKTLLKNIKIS